MPYKPKFCCQCGEKIERIDWRLWTSRRFCELCETELGIHDKVPFAIAGVGILIGLFGFGNYLRTPPAVNVAPNQFISRAPQNLEKNETIPQISTETNRQTANISAENKPSNKPIQPTASNNKLTTKPAETASNLQTETVYMCGAQTKKGTPCSRRVKGGGRCWQHAGQTAMMPQEKLVLVNN